jgi:uncharacterized protein YggE
MDNNILPKWMLKTLGWLLIIFLALLIVTQVHHLQDNAQTIRVSASGKVTAVPDVATITIGVVSQGATPVEVKNTNNQKINGVIEFIKQQGINATEIKTTELNAAPLYNYAAGKNTITGYQANQTVTVTVNEIDKSREQLGKILNGVVEQGANEIQGVYFGFSDTDGLKQLARKKAIEKAKEKAQQLTADADIKLGKIINVSDSNDAMSPAPFAMMNFSARAKSVAPNIEPGSQDVTENITLIFQVR